MQLVINQNAINSLCQEEDIAYLGLFGSTARNEAKKESDVDILVDFNRAKSFFQLSDVKEKLEELFEKKVDLVLRRTISEPVKSYILKDLITLYEKKP